MPTSESMKLDWYPTAEKAKKCKVCGLPEGVYWKVPMEQAALPDHWVCWTKGSKEMKP